ncbi:hypothetical protein EJB05_48742, partial [Eragrostis curvula]
MTTQRHGAQKCFMLRVRRLHGGKMGCFILLGRHRLDPSLLPTSSAPPDPTETIPSARLTMPGHANIKNI